MTMYVAQVCNFMQMTISVFKVITSVESFNLALERKFILYNYAIIARFNAIFLYRSQS